MFFSKCHTKTSLMNLISNILISMSVGCLAQIKDIINEQKCRIIQFFILFGMQIIRNNIKKSGGALTQLSLTLHYSRRIFYNQHCIHIESLFSVLCS